MKPTPEQFRQRKQSGPPLAALTACDYPTARLLDESDIDVILVGDSLGMVALGYPDTTHVTMADMLHHCRAVARGVERTLLVGDMPAGSYASPEMALENARQMREAGMHAVKLEGGLAMQEQIRAVVEDGIPVMAHIGMLPQQVVVEGGYKIKGRNPEQVAALLTDARAVEAAGAFAVVVEIVAPTAAAEITAAVGIPTIGIGSGAQCDGQILVSHDLFGAFPWFTPRFVKPHGDVAGEIRRATQAFIAVTRNGCLSGPPGRSAPP